MGGAAGHMQHPFDLPQVETGKDLIDFFNAAAQEVQQNPAAVKIDGVNVSFKLVEGPQFAVDRGSLKSADIQGITLDRVGERGLKSGMENSVTMLLTILNEALSTVWPELKALGMDRDSSLFLNTEYVAETTNVTSYEDKFIAIHGLNQFYEKTPLRGAGQTRPGAKKPVDVHRSVASYEIRSSANDPAMMKLVEKLKPFAEKYNFKVYGTVPSYTVSAPDFNSTLNSEFTVNLGRDENGEVVPRTQTLGQWLAEAVNPRDSKIKLADGTKPAAIEKRIYGAILEGAILSELLTDGPEWWAKMQSGEEANEGGDIKLAVDAAVIYHATRLLGNDIFAVLKTDAMGVDGQSVTEHEGVVLRNPKLFGPKPVKITGEFLWKGWKETGFGVQSEALTRLNEQVDVQGCQRAIAVVPGAFKPPHKGHLAMINTYAQQLGPNGTVFVYISSIPASKRKGFSPETQAEVTPQQAFDLWEVYTKNLPNVKIAITPSQYKTPVQAAYEFVGPQGPVQAGDCVFMGSSTKGGDDKRFQAGLQKHAIEGVEVRSLPVEPLGDLSATQFREAIKAGDIETISNVFLPTGILTPQEEVMIYNTLGIETQPNQALQELLVQMINEAVEPMQDLEGQTILLVGDSQMAGPMGRNLEKSLESRGAKVKRVSKSGATAGWWNNTGFGKNREAFDNQKYDRVIVSMGGNDTWVAGKNPRQQEIWKNNQLKRFMQKLQTASPDVQFFGPPEIKGQAAGEKPNRDFTNNIYKNTAEELGITYYDMSKVVSNNPGFEEHNWRGDGVHFTPEGGKVFSDAVLSKLGGETTPTTATKPKPGDTSSVETPVAPSVTPGEMNRRDRTYYLAKETGIDPRMIHALETVESGARPKAFAYNAHISRANLFNRYKNNPEKLKEIEAELHEAGMGTSMSAEEAIAYNKKYPKKRNPWKSGSVGSTYAGDAQRRFDTMYKLDPKAAIRGGAFGRYQVLGGNLLKLHDNDPEKAMEAWKSDPSTTGVDMKIQWWKSARQSTRDAANNKDFKETGSRYYTGGSASKYPHLFKDWSPELRRKPGEKGNAATYAAALARAYGQAEKDLPMADDWKDRVATVPEIKKGEFVHDLARDDAKVWGSTAEFEFDKFYKDLDTHFADEGGSKGILSKHGADYKFGREHQEALQALNKRKEEAAKADEYVRLTQKGFMDPVSGEPTDLAKQVSVPSVELGGEFYELQDSPAAIAHEYSDIFDTEDTPAPTPIGYRDVETQQSVQGEPVFKIEDEPVTEFEPEDLVAEGEFQRKMKSNLHGEHTWLLDQGPQDPGSAFPTKRVGGKSNAFLAKEGVSDPAGLFQLRNMSTEEWRDWRKKQAAGVEEPIDSGRGIPTPTTTIATDEPEDYIDYQVDNDGEEYLEKDIERPAHDEAFRDENWEKHRSGWVGDVPDVDTLPWQEDLNPVIKKTRREMYDSYTSGPNREVWEKKVGPDIYEKDILPQIQYVVKNVPIEHGDLINARGEAHGDKIVLDPRTKPAARTVAHELAHIVDQHFDLKLSGNQKEKLLQVIDQNKAQDYAKRFSHLKDRDMGQWVADPVEIEAEVHALRNRLGRRFTVDDIKSLCTGRQSGHLARYINCNDIQKTTDILNSIVKVDTPETRQRQMVAEEQMDEISSMAGGSVEGTAASGGGPWQHMDVEEENEKQKRNSKIPHGTPLVEEDELVEEVLNYLLRKIGE